ncbi:unnamed protein product [Closterium sp. NIES-65]|nr:unnamed protein product [Closterium sp. NIES-65]
MLSLFARSAGDFSDGCVTSPSAGPALALAAYGIPPAPVRLPRPLPPSWRNSSSSPREIPSDVSEPDGINSLPFGEVSKAASPPLAGSSVRSGRSCRSRHVPVLSIAASPPSSGALALPVVPRPPLPPATAPRSPWSPRAPRPPPRAARPADRPPPCAACGSLPVGIHGPLNGTWGGPRGCPQVAAPMSVDALALVAAALAQASPGGVPGDQAPALIQAASVLVGRGSAHPLREHHSRRRGSHVPTFQTPPGRARASLRPRQQQAFRRTQRRSQRRPQRQPNLAPHHGSRPEAPHPPPSPSPPVGPPPAPPQLPHPPASPSPAPADPDLVSSQSHGGAATSGIPQHGAYPWESLPPDALEAPPPGTPQHRWSLWDESPPAERALRVEQRVSNVGTCLTLVVDVLDQLGAYQRRTRHPGALPPMLSGQEQTVAVASAVQILQMLPEIGFVPGSPGSALGPGPAALRRLVLAALQAPLDIVPAVASVLRWMDGRLSWILAE